MDYNGKVLAATWYAMVNDEIGGWCISTVPVQASSQAHHGLWVGEFLSKEVAEYLADLHNQHINQKPLKGSDA